MTQAERAQIEAGAEDGTAGNPSFFASLGLSWPRLRYRLIAPVLALVIFTMDTFSPIQGAIAVLYVLVTLIVADVLSRRGIILVVAICAGLTILSFLLSHTLPPGLAASLRLT